MHLSGIGLTVSKYLAQAGAHVLLLARTKDKLDEVKAEIEAQGGKASVFPCDQRYGINWCCVKRNFGKRRSHWYFDQQGRRSIRRAVHESVDRFMILNVPCNSIHGAFSPLTERLLWCSASYSQIINISSIGVLANATRFSAYVASKAALDAFSRCLSVGSAFTQDCNYFNLYAFSAYPNDRTNQDL